jgi:hypothetical protein
MLTSFVLLVIITMRQQGSEVNDEKCMVTLVVVQSSILLLALGAMCRSCGQ